jgi:phage shock protein PspC (stress-responsive transcriptional regulator)
MSRIFDRWQRRRQERRRRFHDRLDVLPERLNRLRLRVRRSRNGILLGVFRGIAESLGYSVCWTRIIGCIVLLSLSSSTGEHGAHASLLVAGFFYLLAAVLMRGPEAGGNGLADEEDVDVTDSGGLPISSPPPPVRAARRAASVPFQQVYRAPRVDFAELDRQVEGINRRIQRMEGIVTDRGYDWDRRMES